MVNIPRWKIIFTLLVCAMAVLFSAPNLVGQQAQSWMQTNLPSWMPSKTINLGLDLQGGSHILLEVAIGTVIKERSDALVQAARPILRGETGYKRIGALTGEAGGIQVTLRKAEDVEQARSLLRDLDLDISWRVIEEKNRLEGVFTEDALIRIRNQTIDQSIEIVRRRIDETGTREPVIQRQGDDRILVQLPGIDDPEQIKSLLGKTAKLSFHLVNMQITGNLRSGGGNMVLPMQEDPSQTMAVNRRATLTGDMLVNAQFAPDQHGQPAVSFRFNTIGAKKFCTFSRNNTGKLFAIVLDKEIISAPVIREPICGGAGQISGSFSVQEANDLALLLRAGALPAPLKILEERSVGPSLGADSVEAGKIASLVALGLVLVFMALCYGLFGVFADIALVVNVSLIFALLSGLQATLTLPGIAGIVLTIGMAVDANVLIFERIREELRGGRSVISAIDAGYSRAMTTIIDSNLTTLIAAIILYSFGTGPIKGFAVTLAIGILTSFFSAIMVTRLLVVTWLKKNKPSTLPV